tara:strand:+ start:107 stop:388 length:282 start_codon:yes stop_codon:yes gene_type:complete
MAWEKTEIVIADATTECSINRSDDYTRIELPFNDELSIGDNISIDGQSMTISNITDIGGRNETLLLEILHDKSVQRRTRGKTRKSDVQDETND